MSPEARVIKIQSYKDLQVWQRSRILVRRTYQLTQAFPREEMFGLASQLRRAAVSVPANIAEGFTRHGTKDYVSFVSIALGSLAELETLYILSDDLGYVEADVELKEIDELQKMLHALRNSLKEKL